MTNKISIGFKVKSYIGCYAICKDNMKVGVITNFNVTKVDDGEYTVDYLLAFGTHPHAVLRSVNESNLVILANTKHQ